MASHMERTWKFTALKLANFNESSMRSISACCTLGAAPMLGQSSAHTVATHAERNSCLGMP